jgi:hypothetical protein
MHARCARSGTLTLRPCPHTSVLNALAPLETRRSVSLPNLMRSLPTRCMLNPHAARGSFRARNPCRGSRSAARASADRCTSYGWCGTVLDPEPHLRIRTGCRPEFNQVSELFHVFGQPAWLRESLDTAKALCHFCDMNQYFKTLFIIVLELQLFINFNF